MSLKMSLLKQSDLPPWALIDLLKLARQYDCDIRIQKGELVVDAKKLLGVIALSRAAGQEIAINIEGRDEKEAMVALKNYSELKLENRHRN
jgi:phosphotransferase system HPr (HPr) family protein